MTTRRRRLGVPTPGLMIMVPLVAACLAGCTSSAATASRSTSTPPSSSASTVQTTVPPAPSSSSPAPASSTPTPPLSPFERNPAVAALRQWAIAGARAHNAGNLDTPALLQWVTPDFAPRLANVFASDAGLVYPGPVPFTPVQLQAVGSSEEDLQACFLANGFAVSRTTHKPKPFAHLPVTVRMLRSPSGRWRLDSILVSAAVRCDHVKVPTPTWSTS